MKTDDFKKALTNADVNALVKEFNSDEYTIKDIIKELLNPGLDPRNEAPEQILRSDILTIDDLKISVSISELNQAYYQLFVIYHNQDKRQEGIDYLVKSYKLGNKEAENILRQNTNYFNQ